MKYNITLNQQFNSVEVSFADIPAAAVREALKTAGFRWHKQKKVWYGYKTPEQAEAIINGADQPETDGKPEQKQQPANEFGVEVGDIFSASWGYDQTNVNFFQVIALAGKSSVRVREVYLPMIEESYTCSMAADRTYRVNRKELAAPCEYSIFIKDQANGDLKRLKSYSKEKGRSAHVCFRLDTFANAYLEVNDTTKQYESWYA